MTTFTVTSNADSGDGTLRNDLAAAQNGDTINFASNVTTIDLASTLAITTGVTIEGHQGGGMGAPGVTIDGQGNGADFTVSARQAATIDGLTIENGTTTRLQSGNYGAAGGILDYGTLNLSNSAVVNNRAIGLNGYRGSSVHGGIYSGGAPGGPAAGGIYVAGVLNLGPGNAFGGNSAVGGNGGAGSYNYAYKSKGGAGGAGGWAGCSANSPARAAGRGAGCTGAGRGCGAGSASAA